MSAFAELIDGAARVPFSIWALLVLVAVMLVVAIYAGCAPMTTPEQADRIGEVHRELRGERGMPAKSTKNAAARTAPGPRAGTRASSPRVPSSPRHRRGHRRSL